MSVFNLDNQNALLENKIVAGLERLSQVFKILIWEKAKDLNLSPIQIQILIFIKHHSADKGTISYLAQEFNFTKPTISDAIKVLEKKSLVKKVDNTSDARGYFIQLTSLGNKIVTETENFVNPLKTIISKIDEKEKKVLWKNIVNLIVELNKLNIINLQRTCFNCKYYLRKNKGHHCNLLNKNLSHNDIRLDCKEFELGK